MKRGWITWDKTELPPSAFESRLAVVRARLAAADLPALVVYSDVWRSNQGRYLSNFMPYWNRALLVIPRDGAPVLLCGLSPRVYPWIRSVTILEDIRPSANIPQQLNQLRTEKGWSRIGVLDLPQLPYELSVPDAVDVPWSAIHAEPDEAELSMYRRAAAMAREILDEELSGPPVLLDRRFVGRLERRFRRAGAEDLVIFITGDSVSVALEYRGHWVKIVRATVAAPRSSSVFKTELLSGPYPYECCLQSDLKPGSIFAVTTEGIVEGKRVFHGDTFRLGPDGAELL